MATNNEPSVDAAPQDLVVFMIRRPTVCSECGEELWPGRLLRRESDKALCLACADLDHLEYLASGNTAVTRRASRYSRLKAVVVRWSNTRKRYERQGILAEAEAIARAEQESLDDAELRARRQARAAERREMEDERYMEVFAGAIRQQYPGCPEGEALEIARHACCRNSGRIGRTVAAKALEPNALLLAVVAHIRHVHTNYDELLCQFGDRESARAQVSDQVTAVLRSWEPSA